MSEVETGRSACVRSLSVCQCWWKSLVMFFFMVVFHSCRLTTRGRGRFWKVFFFQKRPSRHLCLGEKTAKWGQHVLSDVEGSRSRGKENTTEPDNQGPNKTFNMITPLDPVPAYFFPYEVPVSSYSFPHLCLVSSGIGLFFLAWFFTLQVTSKRLESRSFKHLVKEVTVAFVASIFLGISGLFLCLLVGIYVWRIHIHIYILQWYYFDGWWWHNIVGHNNCLSR